MHIGDNALGDAGMAALAPLLVRLVELSCGDNRLGADAMATIADAHRLTILDIERNLCGPEGARALANPHAPLADLDIYYNNLGPEGARALFGEREHPELQRLQLRANQLGDAGAIAAQRRQKALSSAGAHAPDRSSMRHRRAEAQPTARANVVPLPQASRAWFLV